MMKSSFHLAVSLATLLLSLSAALWTPSPRRLCRTGLLAHSGDKNNRNKRSTQPTNKRAPRFSQKAHYQSSTTAANSGRRKKLSPTATDSILSDDNPMWRSHKSIEDLERTMTKRWGTQLDRWTADPSEYEFEDSGPAFRGKPVLDPWQQQEKDAVKRQQSETSPSEEPDFWPSSVTKSEAKAGDRVVLDRARSNQRRLRSKREKSTPGTTEFYDEDDEGYEPKQNSNIRDGVYQLDQLIAPQPVGGRGTNEEENDRMGFFFNEPATAKAVPSYREQGEKRTLPALAENKTKERKDCKTSFVPKVDSDGNPMFLTVHQAERTFQSFLASTKDLDFNKTISELKTWQELGITSHALLHNLQSMGCGSPLPVQDKACPPILMGTDVLVGTHTGSGKSLAFLVPLAQRLLLSGSSDSNTLRVIIVAPGRELASQIVSVARELLEGTGLTAMLSIGGTTFARNLEQIRKRKPSILVGTPGRIAELVVGRPGEKSGRLNLGNLQSIVLDEFDALLEYKPHRDPTKAILTTLMKKRHGDCLQSVLCSATASDLVGTQKIESFLRTGYTQVMADRDDQLITPEHDSSPVTRVSRTVLHGVVHVPHRQLALETLRRIIHTEPLPQQVLIFADTARRVDIVVDKLAKMGIIAAPLHGGFSSEKADRAEVSRALREGYVGIVVATELAARGLDAPLLTHVINLDLPTDASHYAHRAGRCGRGGRPGVVINLTTSPKERKVPQKFADTLGITMHTVEARSGRLNIVECSPIIDE